MDNNKLAIIEKLEFFLSRKIKVHITKENKEFLNGYLKTKEADGIYILDRFDQEKNIGLTYVFVSEVFDVEEFKDKDIMEGNHKDD
jgi:hypothetical protein